ncbi:hypothetical protein TKK_0017463 [Trichogramma kaykai]
MGHKRKAKENEDLQVTMERLYKKMKKCSKKMEKVQFQIKLSEAADSNKQTGGSNKENVKENVKDPNDSERKSDEEDPDNFDEDPEFSGDHEDSPAEISEGEYEWQDIVGEDLSKSKALAVDIKDDLLNVWKSLCRQGIKKEEEEALLQKYECAQGLQAPEINPQVAAKMSATAKARDAHMLTNQKLASLSLFVIGSLMTRIYNSRKEGMDVLDILEPLRDAGKLLSLQIHKQSLNRRAFIEPGMSKEGQDIIKDSKIEDMLFGNELANKIKESKAFSKEGEGLMKAQSTTSGPKPLNSKFQLRGRPRSQVGFSSYQGHQPQRFSFRESEEINVRKIGGRLGQYKAVWDNITDDKFIKNIILGYTKNTKEDPLMTKAIQKLLEKGVVEVCEACSSQVTSHFFIVKKPDGSGRFILNLKKLNLYIQKDHFKMEDLRAAINLISPGNFLASIDLKDAVHLIPLHRDSRKLVRFSYLGKLYQFHCVPFGLFTAPYLFTKIMKCVLRTLRGQGLSSVIYLDDYLAIEDTFEKCQNNVKQTITLLEKLGFNINYEKSRLVPSQCCRFLGMMIDTHSYCIRLPEEKRLEILNLIDHFLSIDYCRIQDFAKLIGKLVASTPALDYAILYTKILEKEKIYQLIFNDGRYESNMTINPYIHEELQWWKSKLENNHVRWIRSTTFQLTIFTDSSLTGWGASNGTIQVFGHWSATEQKMHINYLELLAIKKALEYIAPDYRDIKILLRVDNTTAISYVNKMGGVRVDYLASLAKEIWQWAEARSIFIFASREFDFVFFAKKNSVRRI